MKLGVISDTHISMGRQKLPQNLLKELKNVDLIIHAGDHVAENVLKELKKVKPVRAVYGNMDNYSIKNKLPEKISFKINDKKIGVVHGHQFSAGDLINSLDYSFPDCDIIIFGHTHRPLNKYFNNKLFFNPGSPTDKRFEKNYTFGIIEINKGINSEIKILKEES
ncbi:MAG: metallophosphoesterase family protein [Bacillota bacterium]